MGLRNDKVNQHAENYKTELVKPQYEIFGGIITEIFGGIRKLQYQIVTICRSEPVMTFEID
jgi:hypothetical protein